MVKARHNLRPLQKNLCLVMNYVLMVMAFQCARSPPVSESESGVNSRKGSLHGLGILPALVQLPILINDYCLSCDSVGFYYLHLVHFHVRDITCNIKCH